MTNTEAFIRTNTAAARTARKARRSHDTADWQAWADITQLLLIQANHLLSQINNRTNLEVI